jgi:predicted ATPase
MKMIVTHVVLRNWRNFQKVDIDLGRRIFLVGPNASGKSNFLDVFRFLHDIASPEGSLQRAVNMRDGIKKIRCLSARQSSDIEIEISLSEEIEEPPIYRYGLGIKQDNSKRPRAIITHERVWINGKRILNRPNDSDTYDPERLTETHLEQTNSNAEFREVAKFFQSTLYLHLVPQLVRHAREYSGPGIPGDPYGSKFLEKIAGADKRTKNARLGRIEKALKNVVPQMKQLSQITDEKEGGIPHLEVIYEHWRSQGAKQRETEFSDGTLRLIGLFWSLMEGESMLLIEEPELSLNAEIVRKLPSLFYQLVNQAKKKSQVLISTHSWELLSDKGIGGEETLIFEPAPEGTEIRIASSIEQVRDLLEGGVNVADAVLPRVAPRMISIDQMNLFE